MILDNALCYLIGPIEFVAGQEKEWREEIIKKCQEKEIDIKFLDPTNKISSFKKEVDEELEKIVQMKERGEWPQLSSLVYKVVRQDHRCIDYSDFVIVYIDTDVHMCGSYFELQSALAEKKPYFVIVKGGKKKTPGWLFGILNHEQIFGSIDEVVDQLDKINEGDIPLDDRWVLIRNEIDNL